MVEGDPARRQCYGPTLGGEPGGRPNERRARDPLTIPLEQDLTVRHPDPVTGRASDGRAARLACVTILLRSLGRNAGSAPATRIVLSLGQETSPSNTRFERTS